MTLKNTTSNKIFTAIFSYSLTLYFVGAKTLYCVNVPKHMISTYDDFVNWKLLFIASTSGRIPGVFILCASDFLKQYTDPSDFAKNLRKIPRRKTIYRFSLFSRSSFASDFCKITKSPYLFSRKSRNTGFISPGISVCLLQL